MGYLDKTTQTVTAHFTKRGRELLADALSGDTSGNYILLSLLWAMMKLIILYMKKVYKRIQGAEL